MKNIGVFQCFVCDQYAKTQVLLENHVKNSHKGVFLFSCICSNVFMRKQDYEDHFNSKHLMKKCLKCEEGCDKEFYTTSARRAHYRRFHHDFRHKCPRIGCEKVYKRSDLFKKHVQTRHFLSKKSEIPEVSEDINIYDEEYK